MNILILSENFSKGGLETHIETYYQALKHDHNLYFGFGCYQKTQYLDGSTIFDGFHFSPISTVQEFLNDVEKIVQIVNDNHIDVIHAHPFYSLFPAIFAANITNTKLVYTYHGRGSINFVSHANDTILYEFAMESLISKVFCVSQNGVLWLSDFKKDQAVYLPNLIDEQKFFAHQLCNQKKWALFSRLDVDKCSEILKFLEYLSKLDIDVLDIYGDGSHKEFLVEYIKEQGLTDRVFFKGYSNDVSKTLDEGQYTGVIGIGRVVLEALIMNYPTILIGFGKVAGMIDLEMYNKIKNINFIPTELSDISCDDLNAQLKKINKGQNDEYQFRDVVVKEFGVYRVSEYIDQILNCSFVPLTIVNQMYSDISKMNVLNENFYQSYSVFTIISRYIGGYTNYMNLKNTINIYSFLYSEQCQRLQQKNSHFIDDISLMVDQLKQENEMLHLKVQELENKLLVSNNTSFLTLIKRDFSKIKYKVKNRIKK